jgi:hypothetical protein
MMSGGGEFSHLLARTSRTRSVLATYLAAPSAPNPLGRGLAYLLQSQRDDGAWGADYPAWTDLTTAWALEALFAAGLSDNAVWQVNSAGGRGPYLGSVGRAVSYLLAQAGPGWGSDIHDACKVLKVLMSLRSHPVPQDRIEVAFDYVIQRLNSVKNVAEFGEWGGAGSYAAALDLFQLADDTRHFATTMERMLALQDPKTGCFAPSDWPDGLKVWHTSNALLALDNAGLPPGNPVVDRGVEWLEKAQHTEYGYWTEEMLRLRVVFSSIAILALESLRGRDDPAVQSGLIWLESQQRVDGSVEGAEGTVVAMAAFARCYPTLSPFPLVEIVEVDALLAEQEQLCMRLTTELSLRANDEKAVQAAQSSLGRAEQELAETRDRLVAAQAAVARLELEVEAERTGYVLRISNRASAVIGLVVGILGLVPLVVELLR